MATDIKGQTIASTYQDLVKRDSGTYSQTCMNIEIQNDSGTALATGLYLESGATTSNVGIGVAAPAGALDIRDGSLYLSGSVSSDGDFIPAKDAVKKALSFESLWLRTKSSYYMNIGNSYLNRANILDERV